MNRIISAARHINAQRRHLYDVREYGAKGDGTTDDSTAIQAAIDAATAAGGGVVVCPPATYRCNVVLKSGVTLTSGAEQYGYLATNPAAITTLLAAGSGAVVDTPVTNVKCIAIHGINIKGLGAGTPCTGIRFRDVDYGAVRACHIFLVADEAILIDSTSIACTFEDILIFGAVLNRSRAAVIGSVDISGTDHFFSRIEAGISGQTEGTVQSANLYCAAWAVRGDANVFEGCIGEFSDVGFYISGKYNRFVNCRGDLNYGHGWHLSGATNNDFAACLALNNSRDTTDTYSGWRAEATAINNSFACCRALSAAAWVHKYGFDDAVTTFENPNIYDATCQSRGHGTKDKNTTSLHTSKFMIPASGASRTLTANSATPSVSNHSMFITANTNPTTITNFTGGVPGQVIDVLCQDDNTTISHAFPTGIAFNLGNGGSRKLRNNVWYRFICFDGASWRMVEPNTNVMSADNGDAAKTLTIRDSEDVQIWSTPLTTGRGVTLSTTGAFNGARFRIIRTASATGAFNLDVGSGPLKSLAAGQWCEVTHNGSAWVLTAFGSL